MYVTFAVMFTILPRVIPQPALNRGQPLTLSPQTGFVPLAAKPTKINFIK
jgi:hypothetical protein